MLVTSVCIWVNEASMVAASRLAIRIAFNAAARRHAAGGRARRAGGRTRIGQTSATALWTTSATSEPPWPTSSEAAAGRPRSSAGERRASQHQDESRTLVVREEAGEAQGDCDEQ